MERPPNKGGEEASENWTSVLKPWSAATTELLADSERVRAWRDRSLAAYRSRFDPVALLRQADAWNERARGDL